ncbi:MAG: peptidoglycan-binding protein [Acetobacterium sp.]
MSEYVKWIQEKLKVLGYDPGPADGIGGPKTDAAIRQFQSDGGLEVDGLVGKNTHIAMLAALNGSMIPADPTVKLQLPNFYDDEFACICGCGLDVCDSLKRFAQNLRDFFGWPLTISSGGRCPPVNREAGGVPDSCHLTGEAFDAYFAGHMNESVMAQMADFAVSQGIGVIRYPNMLFCHFQIPPRNDFIY